MIIRNLFATAWRIQRIIQESERERERKGKYHVKRNNVIVAVRRHARAMNRMSIRQLYNSYELDLLTETRRLSIYNITRTYVCRKQTPRIRARLMSAHM